ncbi:MAG: hypothetical protein HKP01_06375 [Gemmatimonadetes bacterium]|nr:hypothetical protein [Gemmatimonadota bacterium]
MKRIACALFLVLSFPTVPSAQVPATGTDSVAVIPGAQYEAGGWWRFWWGDHYRDAWTTPMQAEVLDCGEFTGGVTPVGATGGRQSRTLLLQGIDGRSYYFRSLDKEPSAVLPPVLRNSIAMDVLQDQISSQHPLGEMIVSPLATAAGIPHPAPKLVIFADEPGLGEFREEFSGVPGMIEEAVDEGLSDLLSMGPPREVVGTQTLVDRLLNSATDRVDSKEFLKARLLDFYVGDWDRHPGQWRWAAYDRGDYRLWYPIPLDRDQAFARLDGVLPGAAQVFVPQLTGFGSSFDPLSLHWNARFVDRRFLADLDRPAFDSTAAYLTSVLTDDVVDAALRRLPRRYYDLDAEWIGEKLEIRRASLRDAADRFYQLMSREVDLHGTFEAEEVQITSIANDAIEVVVGARGAEPYFRRSFWRDETKEVRVYLGGGGDRVTIQGASRLPIKVRLIGGRGEDHVHFETDTRGVSVYDVDGDFRITGERSAAVNTRDYPDSDEIPDPMDPPHRDWGRWSLPRATIGLTSDYGFKLGAGKTWFDYGFRKEPYASEVGVFGALSTALKYEVRLDGDFRFENSRAFVMGELYSSSFDLLNFYGFGNASARIERNSAKVHRNASGLELAIGSFPGNSTGFAVGPVISFSRTDDDPESFINQLPGLYGVDDTWQTGAFARFDWDSRRNIRIQWTGEIPKLTGAALTAQGRYYPDWMDLVEPYGWLGGELRGYLQIPLLKDATHGAARIGGKKIWGDFPWYDAAFVGGPQTLRGWRAGRFAGDASVYGSAELRLHVLDGQLLMPSMWGILGFADVGRVWVDGASPGSAHWGFGGGLWWGLLGTMNIVSLEAGFSDETTTLYLEWSFAF